MSELVLAIANKKYSSWSLRGWLALCHTGQPFREDLIYMRKDDTRARMLEYSPVGLVPAIRHGKVKVWESLAVCEYINELFPQAKLWPDDAGVRAYARSVSTEMHGGFLAMRKEFPMVILERRPGRVPSADAQACIDRIQAIWREARAEFGKVLGGDMLFGRFSIADCMYAPVVSRFVTYGFKLDPVSQAYCDAVMNLPLMQRWIREAEAETEVIDY